MCSLLKDSGKMSGKKNKIKNKNSIGNPLCHYILGYSLVFQSGLACTSTVLEF